LADLIDRREKNSFHPKIVGLATQFRARMAAECQAERGDEFPERGKRAVKGMTS
jgi:hypothetical protein